MVALKTTPSRRRKENGKRTFVSALSMSALCQKLKLIGKDPPTPPEYGMV